jgi:hypothetical protein
MSEEEINLELLGARVLTLTVEIRDLQHRFTAMESHFSALESRFSAMEARLSGIESRLGVMEDRMSSMLGVIVDRGIICINAFPWIASSVFSALVR